MSDGKKKILVVDDEQDIVQLLLIRLRAAGYGVSSASDGEQGYLMAKSMQPDLILLDLMLPKMDGYQVCALLKKDPRYAKLPIILCTARSEEETAGRRAEAGADAFITKPFTPQALLGKIQEFITR